MIYTIPSQVIYGQDKYDQVNQIIETLALENVLVITDKGLLDLGLVKSVMDKLRISNYFVEDGVMPNPKDTYVNEVAKLYKDKAIDGLVAIGGGSVMDAAKAINVLLCNNHDIAYYEKHPVLNPGHKLFAFPTTSGTASEVTGVSVVTNSLEHRKMVILGDHVKADYAVLDPSLTYGLPRHITASTGMDALTHAIEAYVSTLATSFTDAHALVAIKEITEHINKYDSEESREKLMYASTMAGFAFNNAILGLVHAIAHPLGAHFDIPHGVANAIMLPEVVRYNYDSSEKFRVIENILETNNLYEFLKTLNTQLGIPALSDFISPENFEIIANSTLLEPSLHMNPKAVNKKDVISILSQTYGVI
ncbi:iron-containing alcohol dehydrogenase [Acidaminobacter sp. JC074]|uniref:iron-containing alcohol dehydrogenase family protein n=1 Tax=Acidaminobacter sp. JC074 TaxID=2530199 RepID=UPI001F0F2D5E|nr:iron-containing alcohol dehydrogenase [Acidaminobacter sp. JC074]MCH4886057.1 iron-containing alcohol dehydrogenase [Acidaminobacter sp. JC074]